MKNHAKKAVDSAKNFVVDHKTPIAVVATVLVCRTLNRIAIRDYDTFLAQNDLTEDFIRFIQDGNV